MESAAEHISFASAPVIVAVDKSGGAAAQACASRRVIKLATSRGGIGVAVPEQARSTRAVIRFGLDRVIAGVKSSAELVIFSDSVAADEDPTGALRRSLLFWRQVPWVDIESSLSGIAPGRSVDVSGRLVQERRPWPLGYPGAGCNSGDDCPPPPQRVAFLVRSQPDWPFGPVLIFGEGRTRHWLRPVPGQLPADMYEAVSGPAAPTFTAPFVGRPLYFSVQLQGDAASSATAREGFASALAAAMSCMRIVPEQ